MAGQAPAVTPTPEAPAVSQVPPSTTPALAPKPLHYKRNGALIGLGAGMGMVLGAGLNGCGNDCGPIVATGVIWGAIGAGAGAWIGAGLTPDAIDRSTEIATPGSMLFAQRITGRRLSVTTKSGSRLEGVFQLTQQGMVTGGGAVVPFDQVAKVERVTHRIAKGLAIGLLPGVGVGLLAVGLSCEDECALAAFLFPMAIGAGAGAGIGAVQDATHRNADVIFDAKRHNPSTTTMSIAPILSKTRKGVAFSMTWR
jgi:hypothetical protein